MEININDILDQIIGLNLTEASKIVRDNGYIFRIVRRDNNPLVVTRDYNTKRINVAVTNNEVTSFVNLG